MELFKKLTKVKSEIGKISKDSTNPFFKSKYFDVNSLLEHVEPLLAKNDLLLLQPIIDGKVITEIIDADTGEKVSSELILGVFTDPQKMGSAITYYRRYTLQSLLGLQAEDDDANKASKPTPLNVKVIQGRVAACTDLKQLSALYNSDIRIKTNQDLIDIIKEKNRELTENAA